jgi:hypothetical protein
VPRKPFVEYILEYAITGRIYGQNIPAYFRKT